MIPMRTAPPTTPPTIPPVGDVLLSVGALHSYGAWVVKVKPELQEVQYDNEVQVAQPVGQAPHIQDEDVLR